MTLSPSTSYTWQLIDHYNGQSVTGNGVQAFLYEYIPTTSSVNTLVGGLRIKTITNNDGLTPNNVVTSYGYTNGGTQTSGILYSRPVYVQELRNDIVKQVGYAPPGSIGCTVNGCSYCDNSPTQPYYKSPASITPMQTVQGNHIGYNQVQVSQSNNGYSIYRYYGSNIWDNNTTDVAVRNISINSCDPSSANFPAAPLPFEYMRGELKYEGHFYQNGQVLKDATYFPQYVQDSIFTPGLIVQPIANVSSIANALWSTEYTLMSATKIKDSVVATEYNPSTGSSITTTNFSYYNSPFHRQVAKKVTFTSVHDSLATILKYAADYRIQNCDSFSTGWHNYSTAYQYDTYYADSVIFFCTSGSWNCKWIAYQQYRFNRSADRKNYITTSRSNYTDSANHFSACLLTAHNAGDTLLKPVLRLQLLYENPTIESSNWKNLNLLHASYTRYDSSLNPIGFAYPGRTKLVNLQSPSSSFANSSVSGNTIARDGRYVDESVYSFSKGNPTQIVPYSGVAIS